MVRNNGLRVMLRGTTVISRAAFAFLNSPHADQTPEEGDWFSSLMTLIAKMKRSSIWKYLEAQYPVECRSLSREIRRRSRLSLEDWTNQEWGPGYMYADFPMTVTAAAVLFRLTQTRWSWHSLGLEFVMREPNQRQTSLESLIQYSLIEDLSFIIH